MYYTNKNFSAKLRIDKRKNEKEKVLVEFNLECTAIGSLPYESPDKALDFIFSRFKDIPFWPQLSKVNKMEDMTFQILKKFPGIKFNEKYFLDSQDENFYIELEEFYNDYEEIMSGNLSKLKDYSFEVPYSSTFVPFLNKISKVKPKFAKGQIIGPFSLAVSLSDENNISLFYNETYRDIIIKFLSLKAISQIVEIKKASPNTIPIIFMDEPTISHCGTSAFLTVEENQIIDAIKEISENIKKFNALSSVHCCGKANWEMVLKSDIDIISLDAFLYSKTLLLCSDKLKEFLKRGGAIAWGLIPTLDKEALVSIDLNQLETKFKDIIQLFQEKDIDKSLLLKQSLITPSCGCGGLDLNLAIKAIDLTSNLSDSLKTLYIKEVL